MKQTAADVLDFLSFIKTDGLFVASGTEDFILPGLQIAQFGELALPVTALQVQSLIEIAHKAPFGKGSQTIVDETVRSAWEIDASHLSFKNTNWDNLLGKILDKVKDQLGIQAQNVSASLYKLLIYEKGDFFTWHKDSEKEKNMFATMVVTLPCLHRGGELAVRFKAEEVVIDASLAAQQDKFSYTAFYADCDHQVKPLISGYRICLVYNLLQSSQSTKLSAEEFETQTEELELLLKEWQADFGDTPQAVLLQHQYTPANFAIENLKLADKPCAKILLKAARKQGFYARLALVTHYQMGELEEVYVSGRSRYRNYEEADAKMGEIYEETTSIEHWIEDDDFPSLGEVAITESELISDKELTEDEPIEKEEERYTGNEGMTMQYWYHHGAVVLWTEKGHEHLLAQLPLKDRIVWFDYYANKAEREPNAHRYLHILLASLANLSDANSWRYGNADASGLAEAWSALKDEVAFAEDSDKLVPFFDKITLESWLKLMETYPLECFPPIFRKACEMNRGAFTLHFIHLLIRLYDTQPEFALLQINQLPQYLSNITEYLFANTSSYKEGQKSENSFVKKVITGFLEMSIYEEIRESWASQITALITATRERNHINEVLRALVMAAKYRESLLFQQLHSICVAELTQRTATKPEALPDWTREVPNMPRGKKIWDMLKTFLLSPEQRVFHYQAKQGERQEMEATLKMVTIDLDMETIRKGSPHTLLLTKNNADYEEKLRKWKEDVALLEIILLLK